MFSDCKMCSMDYYNMLHRDLRTTKTVRIAAEEAAANCDRNCFKCSECTVAKVAGHMRASVATSCQHCLKSEVFSSCDECCNLHSKATIEISSISNCISVQRKSHRSFSNLRFGEVLILGVCLLSVLRVPLANSAPLSSGSSRNSMDRGTKPKWINPCNIDTAALSIDENSSQTAIPNSELVNMLYIRTKNALVQARNFRNDYIRHTFHVDFEAHHQTWNKSAYDWLPQAYKKLGEPTPEEHLQTLELDSSLKDAYRYLQTYAAALEQVVWDLEQEGDDHQRTFLRDFKEAFDQVNAVLCEFQVVMVERDVQPHPDVTRDVMTEEYRSMTDKTSRIVRDWVIYRDYMNTLEYIVDVLHHLRKGL